MNQSQKEGSFHQSSVFSPIHSVNNFLVVPKEGEAKNG
uniref:Uncharacterized protein n=1 Tax=Tetranychus urticae TaxID=32264 RepID=T1K3M0_TETUR